MFAFVLIPGRFIGTLTFAPFLMLLLSTIKFGKVVEEVPEEQQVAFIHYAPSLN